MAGVKVDRRPAGGLNRHTVTLRQQNIEYQIAKDFSLQQW